MCVCVNLVRYGYLCGRVKDVSLDFVRISLLVFFIHCISVKICILPIVGVLNAACYTPSLAGGYNPEACVEAARLTIKGLAGDVTSAHFLEEMGLATVSMDGENPQLERHARHLTEMERIHAQAIDREGGSCD